LILIRPLPRARGFLILSPHLYNPPIFCNITPSTNENFSALAASFFDNSEDVAMRDFNKMIQGNWDEGKFVCVGLDSDLSKIPQCIRQEDVYKTMIAFNTAIVDATSDLVCAFKPNSAFYEAHGNNGIRALKETISYIRKAAPKVPIIFDVKRADIGNTNEGYASFGFDYVEADGITVHPYLGGEALRPFLSRKEKGIFVLCRTSNPCAGEFQDLSIGCMPLYQRVALRVTQEWNENRNCALVVGATYPEELKAIRNLVEDTTLLIPGVGFQQKGIPLKKQVEQVVNAGKDRSGRGMIINSSRGIIFASNKPDFAEAARTETEKLDKLIRQFL